MGGDSKSTHSVQALVWGAHTVIDHLGLDREKMGVGVEFRSGREETQKEFGLNKAIIDILCFSLIALFDK